MSANHEDLLSKRFQEYRDMRDTLIDRYNELLCCLMMVYRRNIRESRVEELEKRHLLIDISTDELPCTIAEMEQSCLVLNDTIYRELNKIRVKILQRVLSSDDLQELRKQMKSIDSMRKLGFWWTVDSLDDYVGPLLRIYHSYKL